MERTNSVTIGQFFEESLRLLWPDGVHPNRVLLCVSDAASYMKKAANDLSAAYPKMIHVTCLAHGLQRVAEKVRAENENADHVISEVKKVFLKAPSRKTTFKEIAPGVPLPPQPIITRWGTWLNAAKYYSEHFDAVKLVIDALPADSAAVTKVKELLEIPTIAEVFRDIDRDFSGLSLAITKLESRGLSLQESINIIMEVHQNFATSDTVSHSIKEKLDAIILDNTGFVKLNDVLFRTEGDLVQSLPNWTLEDIAAVRFAPITSCDVERSFSMYKALLRANRCSFEFENLRKMFIVHVNR